jgi:predicted exporter
LTESTTSRVGAAWRLAAVLWLLLVLAVGVHQWHFWHGPALDTDVLALLPENEQAPEVSLATRQLADRVSRQVVVMLGAPDWPAAQAAAAAWQRSLQQSQVPLAASAAFDSGTLGRALDFYRPYRDRLLTPAQREQLVQTPVPALLQRALSGLYQPAAGAKMSDWATDPLGLWPQWWSMRAGDTRARPRDGALWLSADAVEWVVLPYQITSSAFSLNGDAVYGEAFDRALAAARAVVPGVRALKAGVPLHGEAAAVQASREINTIGWGSLAAVLLLVWLAFRSVRPIALVALSLGIGCATALSATALLFGQVHLITLVFGASLVGVAEDYGIHYFASRQGHPDEPPASLVRKLLPGLFLALATSVMAYLVLGLAPFPGLRQMAVFSAVGLAAAFLTAVCWFPLLDRGQIRRSRFAQAVAGSLVRWPRLRPGRRLALVCAAAAALCAGGGWQLHTNDDIRQLQGASPALMKQQVDVSRLLGVPSPAQFYLVRGADAEQVLQREEALKRQLDILVAGGQLGGYRAVSDWVPSAARQAADAALSLGVEGRVLAGVNAQLGENLQRPAFAAAPLTVPTWLADPVSAPARDLWLGQVRGEDTSVVMLRGLHDSALLGRLESIGAGLPGVRWVDKTAEVSSLLGRYRVAMTWLLLVAHAVVFAALWRRFRRQAWRAWLPTAVASLLTLSILGWLGQPFQLFNVLALVLLLGIGSDYGIFLLEHQDDPSAWLAVVLGAASTWLSFGLLGLSSTPALRAFGLTLLFGVLLVWWLAPLLRAPPLNDGK